MSSIKRRSIGFTAILALTQAGLAHADQPAIGFQNSMIQVMWGGGTTVRGWQFATLSSVQVTALGAWDAANGPDDFGFHFGDGLADRHTIGIWDIANPTTPLVSLVIFTNTVTHLRDGFRYADISPVTLARNRDYVIGDLSDGLDSCTGNLNNPAFVLTTSPDIEYVGSRVGGYNSTGLVFPQTFYPGREGDFGPNFIYVPEPATVTVLGLGVPLLVLGRRGRSRRSPVSACCAGRGAWQAAVDVLDKPGRMPA